MDKVLNLLETYPNGTTSQELLLKLDIKAPALTSILNSLQQESRIEFLEKNSQLLIKLRSLKDQLLYNQLNPSDLIILELVKSSGAKGTWLKHLKEKSQLHQKIVLDTIKKLERLKLIKQIKSVKTNKKVFMMFDISPSEELTGGSWYTDEEMDLEFVDQLCLQVLKFITHPSSSDHFKTPKTLQDIHEWITTSNITTQQLTIEDVQQLVNRVMYDGLLHFDGVYYSGIKNNCTRTNAWVESCCGQCPVFEECGDGLVNPKSCVYLKEWLD